MTNVASPATSERGRDRGNDPSRARSTSRRIPSWLLAAVAAIGVAAAVLGNLLYPAAAFDIVATVLFTLTIASVAGVGAFLVARVPTNRIGWLLLAAGTLFAVGVFSGGYSAGSVASGGGWPMTAWFTWLANAVFVVPVVIVGAAVPAVFPDGHLPSPRWRWLAWLLVIGTALATVGPAFSPGPINDSKSIENPFGVPALEPYLAAINSVATLTALPAFLGAFAAVGSRFRHGSSVERQQIKWLLAAALVGAIAFPVAFLTAIVLPSTVLGDIAWSVGFIGLIALPIAIGIAILRYHLYEIDRLISRTIGWAVVTGLLVALFAGLVVVLQAALAPLTNESTIAVAASTLMAFALFQPLRRRVQRAVDRRFDRARYDGQRTVDAFAERLRDEVDLGTLRGALVATAEGAVRPTGAHLWLRSRGGS